MSTVEGSESYALLVVRASCIVSDCVQPHQSSVQPFRASLVIHLSLHRCASTASDSSTPKLPATCVYYADLNNSMLCMCGHVSAGLFCCNILFLQGKHNGYRHTALQVLLLVQSKVATHSKNSLYALATIMTKTLCLPCKNRTSQRK